MEWVETIGKSVEEAKDRALDQLGVDVQEAEFEVVAEPSKGLFGLRRGEARVRARVAPRSPRPKHDRRERRGRGKGGAKGNKPQSRGGGGAARDGNGSAKKRNARNGAGTRGTAAAAATSAAATAHQAGSGSNAPAAGAAEPAAGAPLKVDHPPTPKEAAVTVSAKEQADIMAGFLEGLVEAFGYEASVEQREIDADTVEVAVEGDELGLLIGPKGQTLSAVQDLARTVLQRQATGTYEGRVRLDVAGYRERRREALARFTQQMAATVLEEGTAKALEPMHPADRKVVHDTVNEIDGVHTVSEGEDRQRRVVIVPDGE